MKKKIKIKHTLVVGGQNPLNKHFNVDQITEIWWRRRKIVGKGEILSVLAEMMKEIAFLGMSKRLSTTDVWIRHGKPF